MLQVFILFILWNTLVGLQYWAAKKLTSNLSEQQFIEAMTIPFFSNRRAANPIEYLIIIFGLTAFIISLIFYNEFFRFIQKILFLGDSSFNTFHRINFLVYFFPSVANMFLVALYISPKRISLSSKWKKQPEYWHALVIAKRWKYRGFFFAILLEFIFIFSMTNYTNIDDTGVHNSSFNQLIATHYEFDSVEHIDISMQGYETLYPEVYLVTKNENEISLYDKNTIEVLPHIHTLTLFLKKHNIPLITEELSFLDKPRLIKQYGKSKAKEIMSFFNEMNLIHQNANGLIPIGNTITFDSISYTIDTVEMTDNFERAEAWEWLFSHNQAKQDTSFLLLHLTVQNHTADTVYFGITTTLDVVNTLTSHKHSVSMFSPKNELEKKIFPYATNKGQFAIEVPKKGNFQLLYKPRMLEDIKLTFELGDFSN